jgi:beta-glucosidase
VLLQNSGSLPLRHDLQTLVLIGKASQVYAQQAVAGGAVVGEPMGSGGGSSDVVPHYTVTPVQGLRNALQQAGNDRASVKLVLVDDENRTATIDGRAVAFAAVLDEAARADAVVVMAGSISEEGADRATFLDAKGLQLAAPAAAGNTLDWYAPRSNNIATREGPNAARDSHTTAMLEALLAARPAGGGTMARKLVLVLKDNSGVALPPSLVGPQGPAILEAWFPGQEDGNIVADVLFGHVNPSGRLPVTVPFVGKGFLDSLGATQFPGTPAAGDGQQTVTYSEQLGIGYRWYDLNRSGQCAVVAGRNPCVAFPFGHGLSYTSFEQGAAQLVPGEAPGSWKATLQVKNTGTRSGAEVVQLYVSLPATADALGAPQPPRRLVGFQRVELAPGESRTVEVVIDPAASNHPLGVWDAKDGRWVSPAGDYTVWIGRSSAPADLVRAGVIRR